MHRILVSLAENRYQTPSLIYIIAAADGGCARVYMPTHLYTCACVQVSQWMQRNWCCVLRLALVSPFGARTPTHTYRPLSEQPKAQNVYACMCAWLCAGKKKSTHKQMVMLIAGQKLQTCCGQLMRAVPGQLRGVFSQFLSIFTGRTHTGRAAAQRMLVICHVRHLSALPTKRAKATARPGSRHAPLV